MKVLKLAFIAILTLSSPHYSLSSQLPERLELSFESHSATSMKTKNASIFRSPDGDSITFTFRYSEGEPEVRIPVSELGWPTDWSAFRSIQYTFHVTSPEPLSIGFSDGEKEKFFLTEPLAGVRIFGVIPFDSFTQTDTMTPLRPLGYKVWPGRLFTFEEVEEVIFKMRYPSQDSQFTLYNFTLRTDVPQDEIIDKRPLVDRFGQWIVENWEDKAISDIQLRKLWNEDQLEREEFSFCSLGGDSSRQLQATGYFKTEKIKGKWIFVDPHGHPFYSTGMDLVGCDSGSFGTDVTGREYLFEQLPALGSPAWLRPERDVSFYLANIIDRYGPNWHTRWNSSIIDRLKNWGFNTIGNWSDRELAIQSGMPYVLPLHGWRTKKQFPFPYDFPDVFSEEFEANCDRAARQQVSELREDPNLIGWFLGNEPHWARPFGALESWPDMLLQDPEDSATKRKLIELMKNDPAAKEDFLYICAQKYFQTVTNAVRKHDPNHLILGIRFAGRPDERWAELSSIFDAFSINIYSAEFRPDPQLVRKYSDISGKPIIIGEFTAGTPGRGLQGLFYGVHKVRNHEERGKAFRYYVESCAADPYIVGAHWFQLVDDLPTGRPSDGERLNYGFINVIDLPYRDLVEAAKKTHRRIYDLVFGVVAPFQERPIYN